MAYGSRRSGMPRGKKGHTAHTRMGLPKGNPMAGGGNFRRGKRSGGGGSGRTGFVPGRRRY